MMDYKSRIHADIILFSLSYGLFFSLLFFDSLLQGYRIHRLILVCRINSLIKPRSQRPEGIVEVSHGVTIC